MTMTGTKRFLSGLLALVLALSCLPFSAFAAEEDGLCPHHTTHEDCGYSAGTAGADCTHEHEDGCYTAVTSCVHEHDGDCGYVSAVPGTDCTHQHDNTCGSDTETGCTHQHDEACGYSEGSPEEVCTHICSEDSGCVTRELNCTHSHDGDCGYTEAVPGSDCTYDCAVCPVQALIDALPDSVTAENQADVQGQLDAIDDARANLSEDASPLLDCTKFDAARTAVNALADGASKEEPVATETEEALEEDVEPVTESIPISNSDASATSGTCGDNATWTYDVSTCTLTISGSGYIDDYDWDDNPWMEFPYQIKKIVVKKGITGIGMYAFKDCTDVTQVVLPEGLTSIATAAFKNCTSLKSISIPFGVTYLNNAVFANCTGLKTVTIPCTVIDIAYNAFDGCTAMTDIYFGSTESVWEDLVTYGMFSPSEDVTVHYTAAGQCGDNGSNLLWEFDETSGKLTIYGSGAMKHYVWTDDIPWFDYVEDITSVEIQSGVTSVGAYAFYDCGLTSVSLPSTLKSIGKSAFSGCDAITSITIPKGVTQIAPYTFSSSGLTEITIPNTVTTIGEGAFNNCFDLTSVSLPSTLKSIGDEAFYNCSGLRSIIIPKKVTVIGSYAFANCTKLNSVTLQEGLTEIGSYAFAWCDRLANITLPSTVTTIGESAFSGCDAITSITIPKGVTQIAPYTFNSSGLTEITIPNTVTTIGEGAFNYCFDLTSVTLPSSVTSIGKAAFEGCSALTQITLPKSITSIADNTFAYCYNLASFTIPSRVTFIGEAAFQHCDALTQITIPASVTELDYSAFAYCDDLSTIIFKGDAPDIYDDCFQNVTAVAYYSSDRSGWTSSVRKDYGGDITWSSKIPVFISNRDSDGKPTLDWDAVDGAAKYQIYRATSSGGSYTLMKTLTTSTRYTNTSAKAGKTYYYKLKVTYKDGSSEYSRVLSSLCNLARPVVKASNLSSNGKIKLTWEEVDDADYYEICRSTSPAFDKCTLTTTTDTSFTHAPSVGNTYYYKVMARCYSNYEADSVYSEVVSRTRKLARPVVTASNVASSGKIKLTWKAVDGATGYKVYRATSKNGTYTLMKTTTKTSFTNTGAVAGKTYYYKVKAVAEKSAANSAYSEVKSRTCDLERPDVSITRSSKGKPKLTWDKVDGAVEYKVYRATSKNGDYKLVKTTTKTSYTNTSATSGKTYYYKVKAVASKSAANSAYSTVDSIKAK